MAILFPPSLTQQMVLGHNESAPKMAREVESLTGPPILLVQGVSSHRMVSGTIHLKTEAEWNTFRDWHRVTLNFGTRRFIWALPGRAGETYEFQFTGDHYSLQVDAPVGYMVRLNLIMTRQVS